MDTINSTTYVQVGLPVVLFHDLGFFYYIPPWDQLGLRGSNVPSLYFSCPLGAEMYIHPSSALHPAQYKLATTCLPVL